MANMYCKGQKANSLDFSNNYNATFQGDRDIPYPEEKRSQEIDRLMKQSKKEKCHDTDDDRHRSDRLPTEKDLPEAEEKEEAQA